MSGGPYPIHTPIVEYQTPKAMEHEMETGVIQGIIGIRVSHNYGVQLLGSHSKDNTYIYICRYILGYKKGTLNLGKYQM